MLDQLILNGSSKITYATYANAGPTIGIQPMKSITQTIGLIHETMKSHAHCAISPPADPIIAYQFFSRDKTQASLLVLLISLAIVDSVVVIF